jgi:hypothetical protein
VARLQRSQVLAEATRLAKAHDVDLTDRVDSDTNEIIPGLRRLDRYHRGRFDLPWMPRQVANEYLALIRRARANWLKLVVQVQAQRLKVDGFRSSVDEAADSAAWARWQANGMDAHQNRVHRGALALSRAYVTVWATDDVPKIAADSALIMYGDQDASDPARLQLALKRWRTPSGTRAALYDDAAAWMLRRDRTNGWAIEGVMPHDFGRVPVVPFLNDADLEGYCTSEIAPLLPIQDRINETLLDRLMAQKFSAFRQRWATGMVIPEDDDGNPVEPFKAMVDRLWISEDKETTFGEFSATDLKPYIDAVVDDVRQMAALAQVPPQSLLGDIANLSADALVAAESGLKFRVEDKQADFGEAWEDVMRLAAAAAGDDTGATDLASQVIWRDTEARSRAQLADQMTKLAAIGIPLPFLLEEYGLTPQTITRVMAMAEQQPPAASETPPVVPA